MCVRRHTHPSARALTTPRPAELARSPVAYPVMHRRACAGCDTQMSFAGSLRELGVEKGDRVLIYMPMIPEAAVAIRDPGT